MIVTEGLWNCVVVGRWNRAILTPAGILTRMLEMSGSSSVEVEVPLDYIMPVRVKAGGLVVMVQSTRLDVEVPSHDWEGMGKALKACLGAANSLPETPMSAVGVNVRRLVGDPSTELLGSLSGGLDSAIADGGYKVTGRLIRRRVECEPGHVNVVVEQDGDGDLGITLNFERIAARREDLLDWLKQPASWFQNQTQSIMEKVLRLAEGE